MNLILKNLIYLKADGSDRVALVFSLFDDQGSPVRFVDGRIVEFSPLSHTIQKEERLVKACSSPFRAGLVKQQITITKSVYEDPVTADMSYS